MQDGTQDKWNRVDRQIKINRTERNKDENSKEHVWILDLKNNKQAQANPLLTFTNTPSKYQIGWSIVVLIHSVDDTIL